MPDSDFLNSCNTLITCIVQVGSLSSDNELWLSLVLRNPAVQNLTAAEFGGVMCSVLLDGHKVRGIREYLLASLLSVGSYL